MHARAHTLLLLITAPATLCLFAACGEPGEDDGGVVFDQNEYTVTAGQTVEIRLDDSCKPDMTAWDPCPGNENVLEATDITFTPTGVAELKQVSMIGDRVEFIEVTGLMAGTTTITATINAKRTDRGDGVTDKNYTKTLTAKITVGAP